MVCFIPGQTSSILFFAHHLHLSIISILYTAAYYLKVHFTRHLKLYKNNTFITLWQDEVLFFPSQKVPREIYLMCVLYIDWHWQKTMDPL